MVEPTDRSANRRARAGVPNRNVSDASPPWSRPIGVVARPTTCRVIGFAYEGGADGSGWVGHAAAERRQASDAIELVEPCAVAVGNHERVERARLAAADRRTGEEVRGGHLRDLR